MADMGYNACARTKSRLEADMVAIQGYLSFWNDNISYALRGCIVIELAFRGRISMQKDSSRRRYPLSDRVIEVIDDSLTGEVLLDEALKMMKSSEKMSVASWIDLMSGEYWADNRANNRD